MATATQMVDFTSFAAEEGTFQVGRMDVTEEISGLYRYELELFSKKADVKLEDLLAKMGKIGIKTPVTTKDGKKGVKVNYVFGMLSYLEQQEKHSDLVRYTACLVPRFWRLTHTTQSRIFQNQSIIEIIEKILSDADTYNLKSPDDFEFKVTKSKYAKREYVVQYQETDYAFINRWLEHEGIFFSFEQKDDRDKIVFGDSTAAYTASNISIPYRPGGAPSAEEKGSTGDNPEEDVLRHWVCRAHDGPAKVQLAEWNYRTPDVDLKAEAEVRPGKTLQYEFGNHYKTQEEGQALAKVRAEAIKCRLKTFEGESNCRGLKAGYTFEQKEHYRKDFDGKYVLTSVRHRYTQGVATKVGGSDATYENSFTCIPAAVLFRPERLTPWPKIHGTMTAIVDAEDESTLEPPIDELGEYRLRLPFDMSKPDPGKGSMPVRMAQPSTGPNYGLNMPLHYKTEVLVGHNDGDPDLPVILGSVPNATTPSVVKGENKTKLILKSKGENMLLFDDDADKEMVFINAKKDMDVRAEGVLKEYVGGKHHQIVGEDQIIQIKGDRHEKLDVGCKSDVGKTYSLNVGTDFNLQVGGDFSVKVKGKTAEDLGSEHFEKTGKYYLKADDIVLEADTITIKSGSNAIVVDASGVTISGTIVTVEGKSATKVNSGSGSSPKSGSSGSPKAPEAPDPPEEAGKGDPNQDAAYKMSDAPAGGEMVELGSAAEDEAKEEEKEEMEWISIELKNNEGESVPGERYQVKLPDQSIRAGYLNAEGKAKELVPKGGNCKVMFPDLHGDEWKSA